MKRILIAALALPAALHAQAQARDSVITVSANRNSVVLPDRATVFVVVEGSGETPADANTRLETKLKAVNDAVRGLGGSVTADRPTPYGVSLAQNPNGYPMPAVPTTYLSRSVIRLQIAKVDQLSTVIGALLSAGASGVGSPTFESSTIDAARREKLAEVLAVARADAEALAAALGGKLGALVDASTSSNPINTFGPTGQVVFDPRYNSGSAAAPTISVNTSVTVRFRLVR